MKRIIVFLSFLMPVISVLSEINDSTDTKYHATGMKFIEAGEINNSIIPFKGIDTSLNHFTISNPVFLQKEPHFYLGNLGLAHKILIYKPVHNEIFDLGMHQYDHYLFTEKNVQYYRTKSPFTELYYTVGPQEEQLFKLTHTQNLSNQFNIGLKYQRIVSNGFYLNQKSDINSLMVWEWYQSSNERYHFLTNFTFNKLKNNENGGVEYDTLFEDPDIITKSAVSVNLDQAQTRWGKKGVWLQQSIGFGRPYKKQINDTVSVKKYFSKTRVAHTFSYSNNDYIFEDKQPNLTFYPATLYNGDHTRDSLSFQKYMNMLSFNTVGAKERYGDSIVYSKNTFNINVQHIYYKLHQQPIADYFFDSLFYNIVLSFGLKSNPNLKSKIIEDLEISYVPAGYNEGDYKANVQYGYRVNESDILVLHVKTSYQKPVWISEHFQSNHYSWDNQFNKERNLSLSLQYNKDSIHFLLKGKYSMTEQLVYWDTGSNAAQLNDILSGVEITLGKDFEWKNIHFNNLIIFQNYDHEIIHLPDFVTFHSLYYERMMFKKAFHVQVGFNVRYNSAYYSDRYMPVSGQFFLQERKELRFYPVLDGFVAAKIKRARLFAKITHLNQGFTERGYYSAYHFPMPDRALKFGVSWMFYD